ncbi:hypothetical protein ACFY4C_37035 [Actinomadura viridis]|uniref:hypothetical protein n=1 Tax=Actinomadura viridis TaxID=58110 RepID=UPI0036A9B2BC
MTDPLSTDLAQLTTEIAKHLGGDWTLLPSSPDVNDRELLRDDGARLRIRFTDIRSRASLTALGIFPGAIRDQPHPQVQIRAATARGPRAIASDINRRLLPSYLPALDRVRRFQAKQDAAAARRRVAEQIQQLLPEASCIPTPPGSHQHGLTVQWRRSGEMQATVELRDTAEKADLRLTDIPAGVAVQICRLLSPIPRADVQVEDDFPPQWTVLLTRSQDGTPIVDILTSTGGDADHDEREAPYVRIYLNDGEVYEHMSPTARLGREEPPGPDPVPALDQEGTTR